MISYEKYSNATICRHMKKAIGDLAVDKRKENQRRLSKLLIRQSEILYVRPKSYDKNWQRNTDKK